MFSLAAMARERGSPVVVSILPKPIYSHQLFLIIIIIFTETHYQTNLANTETHHQTHRNKSLNPSEKNHNQRTEIQPIKRQPKHHPSATQIRPERWKPMTKPIETHEQTHAGNP